MSDLRAALVGALIVLGGCGGDDKGAPAADSNPSPRAERHSDENRARQGPVILASVDLADGRRVLLRSFRDAGGTCLTLIGLDKYVRQCGQAPSERRPSAVHKTITAGPIAQLRRSAPFEVYGETSPKVKRVWVKYEIDGVVRQARATHLRVTDEKVLVAAGISKPFGYYFKELPADAARVRASAFGSNGELLASANYRNYRDQHPRVFIAHDPYSG